MTEHSTIKKKKKLATNVQEKFKQKKSEINNIPSAIN